MKLRFKCYICVNEDVLWTVVNVSRSDADVFDKIECSFVETNVMDDIGHDEVLSTSFVVEPFKRFHLNGGRFEIDRDGMNCRVISDSYPTVAQFVMETP